MKVNLLQEQWLISTIGSVAMFVFVLVDFWWYKFYPLEAGIFIDISGRDKQDLQKFQEISDYVKLQNNGISVFGILSRNLNKKVTYLDVLKYSEVQTLIFIGTLRHVSIMLGLGFEYSLFNQSNYEALEMLFFAGNGIAFIASAVLYTYIYKRKFAITIVTI
jgi:hypothetical protein